ncbi:unnamed protein product [Bursaphelenchus xylophilus]|uniref:(pine wood nematode) hypothetical protein n=1 Tax=Bursaphelenchus xylophilus TaxID=6326 RepID=A0A1I7RQR1_BURXY|nr:unnamed protein product [Bursaphelenchus xylophilus]CAG9104979.1 unnamed protein product [Bursaphelenchus xylophilus]
MRLFLSVFAACFAAVHADIWKLSGRVFVPYIPEFTGRYKVRVELISGGLWDSICGDAIAQVDGAFHIVCQAPFHVFFWRNLAIYHRFRENKCYRAYHKNIYDGDVVNALEDDQPELDDSKCPRDFYNHSNQPLNYR